MGRELKVSKRLRRQFIFDMSADAISFLKQGKYEYCIYKHGFTEKFVYAVAEKHNDCIRSFRIPMRVIELLLKKKTDERNRLLPDVYHCARLNKKWNTVLSDYREIINSRGPGPVGKSCYYDTNPISLYNYKVKVCSGGLCMPR